MSSETHHDFSNLSEDTMLAVNRLCNSFEQAWRAGLHLPVESILDECRDDIRPAALRELLPLEIEYRHLNALPVVQAEYETRFPDVDPPWLESLLERGNDARPPSRSIAVDAAPTQLGDYTIIERLGAGGMGTVYKAMHRRMHRVVALKILHADLSRKPLILQRFQREVRAVARLSHPNIVAAWDAREEQGRHYLITEYVEGCDLDELVRRDGPLDARTAIRLVLQAARGLQYAHDQNVIHRDIKPANLLLPAGEDAGGIKILDMGLARLASDDGGNEADAHDLTRAGMLMGTAAYMAPEQARNTKNADERSDIYSLGCTLHFLLTGRPAYRGETVIDTILAHAGEPIPCLDDDTRRVPRQLVAVFRRMVAKDPAHRYQSMSELLADLVTLDKQSDSLATPMPGSDGHSRRRLAGLLAEGLFAAVTVLAVAVFHWPRRQVQTEPQARFLRFDGRRSYVAVPSLIPDPASPVTLEAIVVLRAVRVSNLLSWLGPDWMALFLSGRGRWGVSRKIGDASVLIESVEPAVVDRRVHLAATWDGQLLGLFVDGRPAETRPLTYELAETSGGLYIGGVQLELLPAGRNDRFFDGVIESVRISRGVRYQKTGSFQPPSLLLPDPQSLAVYQLDTRQGELLPDLSGNGHQGRIVDALEAEPRPTDE